MTELNRALAEPLPAPLEPRVVMPTQFFTGREQRNAHDSIRRLMCAILEDAVGVYVSEMRSTRPSRTFYETRRWLHSTDRKHVFSFLRICEALDLDPQYIRRGVRLREQPRPPVVEQATHAA